MRKLLMASALVAGMGLVGVSSTQAAPLGDITLKQIATSMQGDQATQVGWPGRWHGGHWRWGSRGGRRCHVRWRSWWRFC
jgi:hypothetical protein